MIKLKWYKWVIIAVLAGMVGLFFAVQVWYLSDFFVNIVEKMAPGGLPDIEHFLMRLSLTVATWIIFFLCSSFNCYQTFEDGEKAGDSSVKTFFVNIARQRGKGRF